MRSAELARLCGAGHAGARGRRLELAREFLPSAGRLAEDTCCLTLLAGAGTRWVKSLAAAKASLAGAADAPSDEFAGLVSSFPLDAPRGLFPVRNFISSEPRLIPMAAYAVDAFRGLGRHVIVVRGWEAEIRERILGALRIDGKSVAFCEQKCGPGGKVLGHGDAARQSRELWRRSRYVLANFGGDVNSPLTAALSLAALAALEDAGENVGLLLPVAEIKNPAYPVILDESGLPRSFGHNKLGGASSGLPAARGGASGDASGDASDMATGVAYTNVGVRAYRTDRLLAAIEEIETRYRSDEAGYSIPGNDPAAHEFALDNVDALLASRGEARILAAAKPEELTPAKSFDEIGHFEEAARLVRAEWDEFRSASHTE